MEGCSLKQGGSMILGCLVLKVSVYLSNEGISVLDSEISLFIWFILVLFCDMLYCCELKPSFKICLKLLVSEPVTKPMFFRVSVKKL